MKNHAYRALGWGLAAVVLGMGTAEAMNVPIFHRALPSLGDELPQVTYLQTLTEIPLPAGTKRVDLAGAPGCYLDLNEAAAAPGQIPANAHLTVGGVSWDYHFPTIHYPHKHYPPPPHAAPRAMPVRPSGPGMPPPPPPPMIPDGLRFEISGSQVAALHCAYRTDEEMSLVHFATRVRPYFAPRLTAVPAATTAGVSEITGMGGQPTAITLDGGRLYVAENADNQSGKVVVVDVSATGHERVERTIATPIAPIDMMVYEGTLYITDWQQKEVRYLDLAGGDWRSIALAPEGYGDFYYGHLLYRHEDQLFVIHAESDAVEVVDLKARHSVKEYRFPGLRPYAMALTASSAAVVGRSGAISEIAFADGTVSVRRPAQPNTQIEGVAQYGDRLYLVSLSQVEGYDLGTGSSFGVLSLPRTLTRGVAATASGVYLATQQGGILRALPDLSEITAHEALLRQAQRLYPPLEKLVAESRPCGRLFVANGNDGSVSILQLSGYRP